MSPKRKKKADIFVILLPFDAQAIQNLIVVVSILYYYYSIPARLTITAVMKSFSVDKNTHIVKQYT